MYGYKHTLCGAGVAHLMSALPCYKSQFGKATKISYSIKLCNPSSINRPDFIGVYIRIHTIFIVLYLQVVFLHISHSESIVHRCE